MPIPKQRDSENAFTNPRNAAAILVAHIHKNRKVRLDERGQPCRLAVKPKQKG